MIFGGPLPDRRIFVLPSLTSTKAEGTAADFCGGRSADCFRWQLHRASRFPRRKMRAAPAGQRLPPRVRYLLRVDGGAWHDDAPTSPFLARASVWVQVLDRP